MDDGISILFPGDGLKIPTDEERDKADKFIAGWCSIMSEQPFKIARTHPDVSEEGFANNLAGEPTNRAFMRSQLRRWWARRGFK